MTLNRCRLGHRYFTVPRAIRTSSPLRPRSSVNTTNVRSPQSISTIRRSLGRGPLSTLNSGTISVQVVRNNFPSNTVTTSAVQVAPGIFPYTVDNGETFYPAAIFAGISNVVVLGDPAVDPGTQEARAGDVIELYATGLASSPAGLVNVSAVTDPVTVTIGSTSVLAGFLGTSRPRSFSNQLHRARLRQRRRLSDYDHHRWADITGGNNLSL